MSQITRDEVASTAHLARLSLTDDQISELQKDFSAILDHIDELQSVDTSSVDAMTHALDLPLRLRDDAPQPSLPPETALGQAPAREGNFFVVPAILASEEA